MNLDLKDLRLDAGVTVDVEDKRSLRIAENPYISVVPYYSFGKVAHLIPMFLAKPLSTSFSTSVQVSWYGTLTAGNEYTP